MDFGKSCASLFDEFVGAKRFIFFSAINDFGDSAIKVFFALRQAAVILNFGESFFQGEFAGT